MSQCRWTHTDRACLFTLTGLAVAVNPASYMLSVKGLAYCSVQSLCSNAASFGLSHPLFFPAAVLSFEVQLVWGDCVGCTTKTKTLNGSSVLWRHIPWLM